MTGLRAYFVVSEALHRLLPSEKSFLLSSVDLKFLFALPDLVSQVIE